MGKILIAAVVSALAAGAASAQYKPYSPPNPASGAAWLALCESDRKACSDALFDLIWELGYGERRWAFCLADDATIEGVTGEAEAWLRTRPRIAARSFEAAANSALVATQRCRRS